MSAPVGVELMETFISFVCSGLYVTLMLSLAECDEPSMAVTVIVFGPDINSTRQVKLLPLKSQPTPFTVTLVIVQFSAGVAVPVTVTGVLVSVAPLEGLDINTTGIPVQDGDGL